MRWDEIGRTHCSVARTLSVVGDRWTLLVLREVFLRTRRFEDFQKHLGVTRHVLADRLKKLVEHGILDRVVYQDRPRRFEYRLTDKGSDLFPVIAALLRWGDRYMADEAGPPLEMVHRECGHVGIPELACPECRCAVTARDMKARPAPAFRQHREESE